MRGKHFNIIHNVGTKVVMELLKPSLNNITIIKNII